MFAAIFSEIRRCCSDSCRSRDWSTLGASVSCSSIISSQRTPRSRGAEGVPWLRWFCLMFLRSDSSAALCDCSDDQPMSFPSLASSFSLVNQSIIIFRSSFLWQNDTPQAERSAADRDSLRALVRKSFFFPVSAAAPVPVFLRHPTAAASRAPRWFPLPGGGICFIIISVPRSQGRT